MIKRVIAFFLLTLSIAFILCQSNNKDQSMVEKKLFGKLADGAEVFSYTLRNSKGMEAKIINYGATVVSLIAPDKDGKYSDVVLGYDDIDGYVNGTSYFGAIVGRYGNRIGKGKFKLDDDDYQLTINYGENHLHGGVEGFNKRLWTVVSAEETPTGSSITLKYVSQDGEEGYPGKVELTVVYNLTNENELQINYTGVTDKTTILNPTHHSYFNLTGDPNITILDHELMIDAENFTPVDAGLITTGKFEKVENTPMDFSKPKMIGKDIDAKYEQLKFGGGYDHNWVLNKHEEKIFKCADLYEPISGRFMEIFTDQRGLQFYSGNFLDGKVKGKNGVMYNYRTGLCLETQCYPDSPNKPEWPSAVLKPGDVYRQTTIYKFTSK